jgi:imidazolonepropionase-like amidohydrolase
VIAEGKAADLLIVDGDPTLDIKMAAQIANHRMVVKGGVVAKAR